MARRWPASVELAIGRQPQRVRPAGVEPDRQWRPITLAVRYRAGKLTNPHAAVLVGAPDRSGEICSGRLDLVACDAYQFRIRYETDRSECLGLWSRSSSGSCHVQPPPPRTESK
jgi:hypothetical protein